MKRTAEQARSWLLPQGIQQTPYTSDPQSQPDGNARPRVFTVDELRNMSRPPGDYSGIDTDSSPDTAIFLKYGKIPGRKYCYKKICDFCIKNKLGDALSYLCVKHNIYILEIDDELLDGDHVLFIVNWAQTIRFEIELDVRLTGQAVGLSPLLHIFENSAITGLRFDFYHRPAELQCNLLDPIRNNSTLKKLSVFYLHNDAIEKLIEVLSVNSSITRLDLDASEVNEETIIRMCSFLERSTNIISLTIKLYHASNYLPLFCKILENNARLESFSVDNTDWDEDAARVLAAVLEKNQHLRTLEIITSTNDELDATAACVLLDALKSNNTLTSLVLDSCDIDDKFAKNIGQLIRINTSLQSLALYCCNLQSSSAKEIADALPCNTCLRTLSLAVDFKETEFSSIMNSCSEMRSLSNLYLSAEQRHHFPFHSDAIALLIRSNKTLESIGFSAYSSNAGLARIEGLDAVLAAVQSNHTLFDFGMLLTTNWNEWIGMRDMLLGKENFSLTDYRPICVPNYDEIVSKVRANAEARKLRFGTVLALGVLAPDMPTEVLAVIADKLTFRNEQQPKKSGTAVMRNLAKMAGAD